MEQQLRLQAGWKAVFLEVQPANQDPAAIFEGTGVKPPKVATIRHSTFQIRHFPSPSARSNCATTTSSGTSNP